MFILIGARSSTSLDIYMHTYISIYVCIKIRTGIKVKNKGEKIGKIGGVG